MAIKNLFAFVTKAQVTNVKEGISASYLGKVAYLELASATQVI